MTDLEITRLCAEAMGLTYGATANEVYYNGIYAPLHYDAQAMALVKKFQPIIEPDPKESGYFGVTLILRGLPTQCVRHETNLNRAICECVALMQKAKK